jgi:DNA-directed RNA polymerase specialized sigma24 family protein
MGTVHHTDEALLLSGDLEDFGRFYDRYVRSLLAFFQRRTRDPEVAADPTAETFAAAMVARGWLGEYVAAQMVEDLPDDQRDAIRAHVLEERDYADIARTHHLNEATVRKRVSRGLKVLRDRAGGSR